MKQIEVAAFGDADVLHLVEGTDAAPPGPGQIEAEVHAAGVNPADLLLRAGGYRFVPVAPPFTPGYDGAGVVTRVGAGVSELVPGDRVWFSTGPTRTAGTYAELFTADATVFHRLPEAYSFAEGAALGIPYTTAYRALVQRGDARAGQSVLVHGASGGVGLPVVQLAAIAGLQVVGTASSAAGRELVAAAGAHHVLDHSAEGYLDEARELTEGRGFDLVVEMAAGTNLAADTTILAPRGRIVVVGSRSPIEIDPRQLMGADSDIRGMAVWNMTAAEFADAYRAIGALLRAERVRPVIGRVIPLAAAADAHRLLAGSSPRTGKVVLQVR